MLPILKSKKHKKSPHHTAAAHIYFLGATLIWAAAGPIIKLTVNEIPPATFLFLRFLIVCVVMLPHAILQISKTKIHKKDYLSFFMLGVLSQTSLWFCFWALKYTSVLDYTIISMSGVILSIYAGHYFFRDKLNTKIISGLVLASIGTLLVVLEPILAAGTDHTSIFTRLWGNIIAIVFNLTWVLYIVGSKYAMGEHSKMLRTALTKIRWHPMRRVYSPTLIVTLSFYVGLITITPIAILERFGTFGHFPFDVFTMSTTAMAGLLYMSLLSSIVAYLLYQWGLDKAHVSDSAIYGYLSPVFTLPFAYLLLGETPNTCMIIGALFIATGVIIAESANT